MKNPTGFFIESLADDMLGNKWRALVSEHPEVLEQAALWMQERLTKPETITAIRKEFHSHRRIPHVYLGNGLKDELAEEIYLQLRKACFRRHHHHAYPLWVARREEQDVSLLTDFVDWLSSTQAAEYHAWLANWYPGSFDSVRFQVQATCMSVGDHFPMHVDTDKNGLGVVYNFSKNWKREFGGHLYFPNKRKSTTELFIESRFNHFFLFRPRHAFHGVSAVELSSYGQDRFTITAFYLYE